MHRLSLQRRRVLALFMVVGLVAIQTHKAEMATVTVFIEGQQYVPRLMVVPAGTTVTWINQDTDFQMVVSVDANGRADGVLSSGFIPPGESYTYTLRQPGVYRYESRVNPSMRGEVHVEEVIPTEPGRLPVALDRVAPISGLSVRALRSALLTANEVGTGFVVTSEANSQVGVGIARNYDRREDDGRRMIVKVELGADAPLDPRRYLDEVAFALNFERRQPLAFEPLTPPASLGETAYGARVTVSEASEAGDQFVISIVVWRQGPVLAVVNTAVSVQDERNSQLVAPGDDIGGIAERQQAKLVAFLAGR